MKLHTQAREAIAVLQPNQRIFIHGAAATPLRLLDAILEDGDRLRGSEFTHLHTMGASIFSDPGERFRFSSFFMGSNLRPRFNPGRVDYIPCSLSEVPQLFRSGRFPIDVALIHVSPPDQHGYCSLGTSVDIARAAVDTAQVIVAQINPHMPRVHGDGLIHVSQIHHAVEVADPLPEEKPRAPTLSEQRIAELIAPLIEDGSTLQMGIGSIPDAVLLALKHHRHLGIHTEMWTDGLLDLLRSGAVDNSQKKIHPGKTVSGFVVGSRAVYDYVHDNPAVINLDIGYINNPINIARNPKVVAINSAVEIDLTGQVCADSIGSRIISGAGGQMDFMRGASLSPDGKPIIALTSRTKQGIPRIVSTLRPGAGVVTPRAYVHYVVTEHGIADLYGKTLAQRCQALLAVAHPADREQLAREWHHLYRGTI